MKLLRAQSLRPGHNPSRVDWASQMSPQDFAAFRLGDADASRRIFAVIYRYLLRCARRMGGVGEPRDLAHDGMAILLGVRRRWMERQAFPATRPAFLAYARRTIQHLAYRRMRAGRERAVPKSDLDGALGPAPQEIDTWSWLITTLERVVSSDATCATNATPRLRRYLQQILLFTKSDGRLPDAARLASALCLGTRTAQRLSADLSHLLERSVRDGVCL